MNRARRILIAGAGIAGPALACALEDSDYEVTVVEKGSALREGGQAVDFRGPVHRAVLERLALWEPISQRRTPSTELLLLDRRGRVITQLPAVMISGDVEIVRGRLCRLLYEKSASWTSYRFGQKISMLAEDDDGVSVELSGGQHERYDLVIGADGLHSGVRALAFGKESSFLRHHGYRLATFSLPNHLRLDRQALTYTVPGRALTISADSEARDRARAMMIFRGGPIEREDDLRTSVEDAYRDVGWEAPHVLQHLRDASDLYIDQIGTIAIDRWSSGRVALLGDAAYGGTLGGQGTPLAIIGAYVLAGELRASGGDHRSAFERYEARMRPYATRCQKGAERAGSFFAPRTALGLWMRNLFYRAFTSRLLIGQFEKMVKAAATDFELPEYGAHA